MRQWIWIIILFFFSTTLGAGNKRPYSLIEIASEPDKGHLSANDFERVIERALTVNAPARAENCRITLKLLAGKHCGGSQCFQFIWSCDIVPSENRKAERHFTRRGAMFSGRTPAEARLKVEREIKSSGKVKRVVGAFARTYGAERDYKSESLAGPDRNGRYWYIREVFITAPKKK